MTYFLPISVGAFTKGLGFADLARRSGRAGRCSSRCSRCSSLVLLRKQER